MLLRKNIVLFSFLFLFFSCKEDKPKAIEKLQDKVAEAEKIIPVELKIDRFEQKLKVNAGEAQLRAHLPLFAKDYGSFFWIYCERMINIGKRNDPKLPFYLNHFLTDQFISELFGTVAKKYPDLNQEEKALSQAFTLYHYYFKNRKIPRLVSFISGFNYGITATDSVLGIGLDLFLGSKHEYYSRLQVPQFLSHFMSREYLVSEAVRGWVSTEFPVVDLNADLLTEMIQEGKVMLAMDALLPDVEDSVKIRYTAEQLLWIKSNEERAWKYFVEHQLLFKKELMEKKKYMGDAPFTAGLPRESPPRLGQYFGWQIVRAYAAQLKDIDLEEIMMENNAQKILNLSKYKPNKNL